MNIKGLQNVFLIIITACLLLSIIVSASDDTGQRDKKISELNDSVIEYSPDESVFYEIHVTPDGAYGVDSEGAEWEFDFSTGEFETSDEEKSKTVTRFGRQRESQEKEGQKLEMDMEELDRALKEIEKNAKRLTGLKLKVVVEEDETIKGPVIAVGEVIVRGSVIGDVVSYKRITVTSTGKITGNATAPDIIKMRGGRIIGKRMEDIPSFDLPIIFPEERSSAALIATISIMGGLFIITLLGVVIAPKPVQRIKDCLRANFFKSFLLGILFWIAFAPLFGLLILTIIGIPVAAIALPIATLLGILLGIIGLAQLTGAFFAKYVSFIGKSQLSKALYGILLLNLFWILMSAFYINLIDVYILFLVISIVIWSVGISAGVGAVILTRFGSRDSQKGISIKAEVDGTPPPPTPPPLKRNSGL